MVSANLDLKPIILAGGKATRMGEPKHMLRTPDGATLLQRTFDLLRKAVPSAPTIYISAAQDSVLGSIMNDNSGAAGLILDQEKNNTSRSAGPASGLLAAHHAHPEATFLVVGCDYPLLTVDALKYLQQAYDPPVSCFQNADGFCEPLLGIWSPLALRALEQEVATGRGSLTAVIEKLGGSTVAAPSGSEQCLFNVNNKEEWRSALDAVRARG